VVSLTSDIAVAKGARVSPASFPSVVLKTIPDQTGAEFETVWWEVLWRVWLLSAAILDWAVATVHVHFLLFSELLIVGAKRIIPMNLLNLP
jgi:hypothetical protein